MPGCFDIECGDICVGDICVLVLADGGERVGVAFGGEAKPRTSDCGPGLYVVFDKVTSVSAIPSS